MAIQLPTLKRIEPEAQGSVGRLQANIPSGAKDLSEQQGALHGLAEQGIKFENQQADQAADSTSTNQMNEFDQWHKARVDGDPGDDTHPAIVGLKYQDGDPTVNFKAFEKEADAKLKELSQAPGGQEWSQETQNLVNRRLGRKAEELRINALTAYGSAQHKYDVSLTDNTVKLAQSAMPEASTHIDPESIKGGDKSTLIPINQKISDIENAHIAYALAHHGAEINEQYGNTNYTDAAGVNHKVNIGPETKYQIKKAVSDGLYNTAANLSNQVGDEDALAKAQVIKDNYGDRIDEFHHGALAKKLKDGDVAAQAYKLADQARANGGDIEAALKGAKGEVYDKALRIMSEQNRNLEQDKNRTAKALYNPFMNQLLQRQQTDSRLAGPESLEKDPDFQAIKDKLTPVQLKAAYQAVQPLKTSSSGAVGKMQNLIFGNSGKNIQGMDPAEFAQFKIGLSESASKKYDSIYEKANMPQTGVQIQGNYKYADKELMDQMVSTGQISKNEWGKFVGPNETKWINARSDMEAYLATGNGQPMKPEDIKQHVREYVQAKLNNSALSPIVQPKTGINGGGTPPPAPAAPPAGSAPPAPPSATSFGSMSPYTRRIYLMKWRKAQNFPPGTPLEKQTPDSPTLEAFIKADLKGGK